MKTSFHYNHKFKLAQLLGLVFGFLNYAAAAVDTDSTYSNFDSIVQELTSSTYRAPKTSKAQIDVIKFHAAFGAVTSRTTLSLPSQFADSVTLKGYELRLGIDLFDPKWVAEAVVRSFNAEKFDRGEASLKEFDLSVNYKSGVNKKFGVVLGGGIAARYLDIRNLNLGNRENSSSTPASILAAGISSYFSPNVSLMALISYRNALISDSADEGALDGAISLSGHF